MDEDQLKAVDPSDEIAAMQAISKAFKGLDPSQLSRVLSWANNLYLSKPTPTPTVVEGNIKPTTYDEQTNEAFSDVADFFAFLSPRSDTEKALVVGYWLQEYRSKPDVDSQSVNWELKHLGFKVSNIARAFDLLTKTKPQLVIQTRKTGSTQQARRRFKVTYAGIKRVEQMIKEASGEM